MKPRVRLWISTVLVLLSTAVFATFAPDYYRHFTGPSQATLGARVVFDAMQPLLRSTRGVLMQAHVKFVLASGQPIEVSQLRLRYRRSPGREPITCISLPASRVCSVLSAPDEFLWRVAKWVGLGKRRAFTVPSNGVPGRDELERDLLIDGLIPIGDGEYIAETLNEPSLLEIFRHIDLSVSFPEPD